MEVEVQLLPPLCNTAGRNYVRLSLKGPGTMQKVVDALLEMFPDPGFRRHLYDTGERLVPAWCAFINGRPAPLGRGPGLRTAVAHGDEISLLLNLAGG